MFSGIIEELGIISHITTRSGGLRLNIKADAILDELKIGDSVAVNGVCLTIVAMGMNCLTVDVSFETLNKSNLESLHIKDKVNLERAIKLSNRLSGHIVLGHVDKKSKVLSIEKQGDFYRLRIKSDDEVNRYCVNKGSIAINGISLTISDINSNFLEFILIPHTFNSTNLKFIKKGEHVNIEFDIIGKYIERFVSHKPITEEFLKENGF